MTPLAFAGLLFPVLLGVVAGGARLFTDPAAAIAQLNRFALMVAFPALIVAGLLGPDFSLPIQPGFWLAVPLAMGGTVAVARLGGKHGGTMALSGIFGNVAYVGLPLCVSVLGDGVLGLTSLAVSLFVLVSLMLGPPLLVRWSPTASGGADLGAVLRQPLFWAPPAGLLLRVLPDTMRGAIEGLIAPLGASAAPVALFLLGLYLWTYRGAVGRLDISALGHVVGKLFVFPGLLWLAVLAGRALGWQDVQAQRVMVLLASTPTAIATFALAQELHVGRERVAQAIVGSTLVSLVTLPASVWAVLEWLN